jgi:hypothetical protein
MKHVGRKTKDASGTDIAVMIHLQWDSLPKQSILNKNKLHDQEGPVKCALHQLWKLEVSFQYKSNCYRDFDGHCIVYSQPHNALQRRYLTLIVQWEHVHINGDKWTLVCWFLP